MKFKSFFGSLVVGAVIREDTLVQLKNDIGKHNKGFK